MAETSPKRSSIEPETVKPGVANADLIFVMPVGPQAPVESIDDSVEAIVQNKESSTALLVSDDSAGKLNLAERYKELADVEVITLTPDLFHGKTQGPLFVKLGPPFRWALRNTKAKIISKLDDDSILIRPGIEPFAREIFENDPKVGVAGSFRWGWKGPCRGLPKRRSTFESTVGFFVNPPRAMALFPYYIKALRKGWRPGEMVCGQASFYRRETMEDLDRIGVWDKEALATCRMGEDQLHSMFACALGWKLADFPKDPNVLALHWKWLPDTCENIWEGGAMITHSVRDQELGTEEEIRAFFRDRRRELT